MRGPPERGPPKFKLFNLLSWTHEMVVLKFSTSPFVFAFLQHQLLRSKLRTQLSGEHLEARNVMHSNKLLL